MAFEYQDRLKDYAIIQSMSKRGNCYDNTYMESFLYTIKKLIHEISLKLGMSQCLLR